MTSDSISAPTCSCCGRERDPAELSALQCHPEIQICHGCLHWLAPQSVGARATPIFPVVDMVATRAFYARAGFTIDSYDDGYAFVLRDGREVLHLASSGVVDPERNPAACYLHAPDADAWHTAWVAAGLPVGEIADQEWGMREFEVRDPSGNLLRVGRNL
jgi:hypothetical protein